jgi:aerobic-type carbon monoxide dehydrogenase small subunit (CoxS/CutS family)
MAAFVLLVNGREHRVDADPGDSLLAVLRDDLGLAGSKFGCGEGQCGACTVHIDGQAVRSCVTKVSAANERRITTIEGLAGSADLHPVQQAFLDAEAFQCGYCTPGMIMALAGLLQRTPDPSDADISKLLDRNVCRCGTFPRIVAAVHAAAAAMRKQTGSRTGGEK